MAKGRRLASRLRIAGEKVGVGCGEGADAIWLARAGWQVTGVDVSEVALENGVTFIALHRRAIELLGERAAGRLERRWSPE
jgi:2-polyprenyl-3-methyl-5-hydroxy-6-metoxy-1,4-benzoquinol methylase